MMSDRQRRIRSAGIGIGVIVACMSAGVTSAAAPDTHTIAALQSPGTLLLFQSNAPAKPRSVQVSGITGAVIGIDVRPADGKLYALTEGSELYTVDPKSGKSTLVSRFSVPFRGGVASGVDFNPQADRLRVVSSIGENLRVNVDVGAVAIDGALTYAQADPSTLKRPAAVASAYTKNVAKTPETVLFNIDHERDTLVRQDPPNDGVLVTIGKLGIDCDATTAFDIHTARDGREDAFAICKGTLYRIDLETGSATSAGKIGDGTAALPGMAILD